MEHPAVNLKKILKGVSRSFYLSLILLPKKARWPMGLAFLSCKAADTIADTNIIDATERLRLLDAYQELFAKPVRGKADSIVEAVGKPGEGTLAEKNLIQNLPALMESLIALPPQDWLLIQELVLELTQGMQIDLSYFNPKLGEIRSFETKEQLEQYIYYVAGCVGKFWTKMIAQHFRFGKRFNNQTYEASEKLGKGLQLVNVLRDLPHDLRKGRCYIPQEFLNKENLKTGDLLDPKNLPKAKPVLLSLAKKARGYLKSGETYCSFYPWYTKRLQAVVKLPMYLGFQTLDLLEKSEDWLDPAHFHKVSRRQVYQTLLSSLL